MAYYHTKRSIAPRRAAAAATSPREPIHTLFNPISTVPGTTQLVLRYRHFRYLLMVVLRRGRKKEDLHSHSTQLTHSLAVTPKKITRSLIGRSFHATVQYTDPTAKELFVGCGSFVL